MLLGVHFLKMILASLLKKHHFDVSGLCLLVSVWQEKSGNTCTQLITSLWILYFNPLLGKRQAAKDPNDILMV